MDSTIPEAVYKHRGKCPKCGKKGLGIANHPHAYGYKDWDRFYCRYCKTVFKKKDKTNERPNQTEEGREPGSRQQA